MGVTGIDGKPPLDSRHFCKISPPGALYAVAEAAWFLLMFLGNIKNAKVAPVTHVRFHTRWAPKPIKTLINGRKQMANWGYFTPRSGVILPYF